MVYRLTSTVFAMMAIYVLGKGGFATEVEFRYMVAGFFLIIIGLLFNICGMIEDRKS